MENPSVAHQGKTKMNKQIGINTIVIPTNLSKFFFDESSSRVPM